MKTPYESLQPDTGLHAEYEEEVLGQASWSSK